MENTVKKEIDEYLGVIKDRLDINNIKKHISSYNNDEEALEYFEDKIEEIDFLVNDVEEFIGNMIVNLDDDDDDIDDF